MANHTRPRLDLVERYRAQLATGTYRMPTDEQLAEAILACGAVVPVPLPRVRYLTRTCACGNLMAPTATRCRECRKAQGWRKPSAPSVEAHKP